MLDNATRKNLLQRSRELGYPGSIIDVYKAFDNGIDLLNEYEGQQMQEQMQVAQTPEQQETGLREEHARGNTQASMAFPNVQPGQSFNTVGMQAPINVDKYSNQGHLVESYKNVPPGIQDLPTGPYEGTVIETPAEYQTGGFQYPVVNAQSLNMPEGSGKKATPFSKNIVFENTPASTEALNWYKQYLESPMHREMLSKEDPENVDWITKMRLKNLENIKMKTHTMPHSKHPEYGGTSHGASGNINIYPSGINTGTEIHEISHSSDRPIGFPYIGTGGGTSYFGKRLIPKSSIQLSRPSTFNPQAPESYIDRQIAVSKYNKDKDAQMQLQGWKDYVTIPTEVRARLNTIRMRAQQQNIYDPFTEKISEEQYQNLLKSVPTDEKIKNIGMNPLKQLKDIYPDEQIMNMLNTFSKGEQQPTLPENTQFAQTGGLRKHMMDYMDTSGRDTSHVNLVMDAIGQHESKNITDRKQDSYKIVDNKPVRYDGPGRGLFQFEVGEKEGGNTAINRTANFLKHNTDKTIEDFPDLHHLWQGTSVDFSTLSKKDQEALFIGDKIFGGAVRRDEFDDITRNRETPPTSDEVFMYWLRNHKGSVNGKPVVNEIKDESGTIISREINLTEKEIKDEKKKWNRRTKKIFRTGGAFSENINYALSEAPKLKTAYDTITNPRLLNYDKLNLSANLKPIPKFGWGPSGPTLNIGGNLNLKGAYTPNKRTNIYAGVDYPIGSTPQYSAGVRFKFKKGGYCKKYH